MRRTGILFIFFSFVLGTFGCGSERAATNASSGNANSYAETSRPNAQKAVAAEADTSSTNKRGSPISTSQQLTTTKISLQQSEESTLDTAPTDRKIVRNANLDLEADSPEDVQQRITSIAEQNGGFVVESQQTSSDVYATKRDSVTMSIRVPSAKFGDTVDQIRQASSRVISETTKGDDVTEEFIDVQARLTAKKALEQQILEIMKRANTVDEALTVHNQLADVRGEIEKIEGRMRFLQNQSSLSTIVVKLKTPAAISANSEGIAYRLRQSFGTGLDFALNFVLGLVTFVVAALPFALLIGLPTYLVARVLWRRRTSPRSVGEIAKEELDSI